MPFPFFEALCLAIILLSLGLMQRQRPAAALVWEYLALALAAYLGEESCVGGYRFYSYAETWHARLHLVPILVPLIWPLVVLSAEEVVDRLWPESGITAPLLVGATVAFDASMVEVIAVRARLWSWAEPGYLGVPLIGILGWGFFAAGASWARRRSLLLVPCVAPACAHLCILATWWGLFRWWRPIPYAAALLFFTAAALLALRVTPRTTRRLDLPVALPRMLAAFLFLAVLVRTAPKDPLLWLHTALVAMPYLALTRFRGVRYPRLAGQTRSV